MTKEGLLFEPPESERVEFRRYDNDARALTHTLKGKLSVVLTVCVPYKSNKPDNINIGCNNNHPTDTLFGNGPEKARKMIEKKVWNSKHFSYEYEAFSFQMLIFRTFQKSK